MTACTLCGSTSHTRSKCPMGIFTRLIQEGDGFAASERQC